MRWLGALPDEAVARSPVLSVFYGWMLMVSGDLGAVEARLDDATRTADERPGRRQSGTGRETDELRSLPATIAVLPGLVGTGSRSDGRHRRHAQHALDLTGPDDHLARGTATAFLGLTSWAHGDVATAVRTFADAVDSLRAAGNLADCAGQHRGARRHVARGRTAPARRGASTHVH